MLVPKIYRPRRASDVIEPVRRKPLARVARNGTGTPFATHAPVIIERLTARSESADAVDYADVSDVPESLTGATLLAHLNQANDHAPVLREGGNVLIVFQGPHGYISPMAYDKRPAAPTWNFITVHLRGRVEPIPVGEPTLGVVTATVRALEQVAGTGWDMTSSLDYFRNIQPGVSAFRVYVESVEAMFKLSQEHSAAIRGSIRDHLSTNGRGLSRELSQAMWAEEFGTDGLNHALSAGGAGPTVLPRPAG